MQKIHSLSSLLLSAALCCSAAQALTSAELKAIVTGETDARITALNAAMLNVTQSADDKTAALVQSLSSDAVKIAGEQVFIIAGDKAINPLTGEVTAMPANAEDVVSNNRLRAELDTALAALKLLSKDDAVRTSAIKALMKDPDVAKLPLLDQALAKEINPAIKAQIQLARAAALLSSADAAQRRAAAHSLGESQDPATQQLLNDRLLQETDVSVKTNIQASLMKIKATLGWGDKLGVVFTGLSLGSILLLAALGLAITYGLMGVINMAHGELMMIGAYATYVVQGVFRSYFPSAFDWYLLAAIPVAFAASAIVGAVLERLVIRFLYGRPLETLLATWGISLMLMQLVRSVFGAQNVGVENPSWMSGALMVLPNLSLPFNRVYIVLFAIAVLAGIALLISKTRLGLFVRGVTQNRSIAACMGVNTARIDTYAFALGSGIAGLAGCALSQIGNVGPDLGQSYVVDSFMVVVLGGVGQLAGTVYAALGLGLLNKLLEGWAGAVLAKIAVLVFIIVFIQKRPQGIFAMKGRSAEA
jgi:urea transport system permease protein